MRRQRNWFGGIKWAPVFVLGAAAGALIGLSSGVPRSEGLAATPELTKFRTDPAAVFAPRRASPQLLATIPGVPDGIVGSRPRIAIVIDDLGASERAFAAVDALPGPVTFAFLPYADRAQSMIDRLSDDDDAILHLPMEPFGDNADAGPTMIAAGGTPEEILAGLEENLALLTGYSGVNNHTGSRFTSNREDMAVVLDELDRRGLFFLDSVTTPRPVAHALAGGAGYTVLERNVFLDGDYDRLSEASVRRQLAALETIALTDGEAIGIGHPYGQTLATLGPWMAGAAARGFDLVLVRDLARKVVPKTLAAEATAGTARPDDEPSAPEPATARDVSGLRADPLSRLR